MNDKWFLCEVVYCDYSSYLFVYVLGYKISVLCLLKNVFIFLQNLLLEIIGLVFSCDDFGFLDNDLILNYVKEGLFIGEWIIVYGYVCDGFG